MKVTHEQLVSIAARRAAGETFHSLAREHGISLWGLRKRLLRLDDDAYALAVKARLSEVLDAGQRHPAWPFVHLTVLGTDLEALLSGELRRVLCGWRDHADGRGL